MLHADDTIELTKGGFKARIDANGRIFVVPPATVHQPEQLFGRITGDQLLTTSGKDSGVRLEGDKLVMFSDGKVTNRLGAIDPPTMGHTALVLTASFFIDTSITAP